MRVEQETIIMFKGAFISNILVPENETKEGTPNPLSEPPSCFRKERVLLAKSHHNFKSKHSRPSLSPLKM